MVEMLIETTVYFQSIEHKQICYTFVVGITYIYFLLTEHDESDVLPNICSL